MNQMKGAGIVEDDFTPPAATLTPPLLHRIEEAARILGGIGRTTMYAEIKAGRLKTVKIAGRSFIAQAELERYVLAASA